LLKSTAGFIVPTNAMKPERATMDPEQQAHEFVRECVSLESVLQDGRDLSESEARLVDASIDVIAGTLAPKSRDISLDTSAWSECQEDETPGVEDPPSTGRERR